MDRSFEMVIGILGIVKAGCVYVPLNPSQSEAKLNYVLKDVEASILLSRTDFLGLPNLEIETLMVDEIFLRPPRCHT